MTVLRSVAVLFAGQGNPTVGMGADIWDTNETTRQIWDCASDVSGIDIRRLCLKGPMNKLVRTTVQQVAVTAINVSLYALCRNRLNDYALAGMCGHSVGEYAALYAAGVLTLEDLFRAIDFRSRLMDELSQSHKGAMLAVKPADYAALSALIETFGLTVDISCDNSRRQQVVGGTPSAIADVARLAAEQGLEVAKLGVSGGWHTRLMQDGVQRMADFLDGIEMCEPAFPVLMNVTAEAEFLVEKIKRNLSLHLTHTVRWTSSMDYFLASAEPIQFIEISNKPYLSHMLNDFEHFSQSQALHCKKL